MSLYLIQATINALQSQLWETQQKLKLAQSVTTADPSLRIGPGLERTRPNNVGPYNQNLQFSSRTIHSPGRTRPSLDQVRGNPFGSPGRPRLGTSSQPGSRSIEDSPVKSRPDPGIRYLTMIKRFSAHIKII